ncbi:MAG: glycosyltransferase [Armatimonadota bacterium]
MAQEALRILQVLAGVGAGGAEALVAQLTHHLRMQGHVVEVVDIWGRQSPAPAFEKYGVKPVRCVNRGPISMFYPGKLVRFIRQFNADIVHCHETAWYKSAMACRWTHVPCVFTLHNYHDKWLREHARRLRFAARLTSFCVGVAPGIEQLFTEILGVPPERTVYIRNGIVDVYMSEPPAPDWKAPIPENAILVAMVARFDRHQKDQPTLIRAAQIARRKIPNLHLVLVGDGPRRSEVEALTDHLNARGYVHFLGLRDDVRVLLHHIDLFVLSSTMEGESLAILEAMSARRPIVATAVGGTPSLLADGDCGVLVPPGDAQAMAQAIVDLLQNKEKAQQLAVRARQRFLQEYTIDRMAERYLDVYREAIQRRKGSM